MMNKCLAVAMVDAVAEIFRDSARLVGAMRGRDRMLTLMLCHLLTRAFLEDNPLTPEQAMDLLDGYASLRSVHRYLGEMVGLGLACRVGLGHASYIGTQRLLERNLPFLDMMARKFYNLAEPGPRPDPPLTPAPLAPPSPKA